MFGVKSALRNVIVIYCLNDNELSDQIKILISLLLFPKDLCHKHYTATNCECLLLFREGILDSSA